MQAVHVAELDEELRRLALDAALEGVLVAAAERPGFPVIYANAGFTRLTGYAPEEVIGRSCSFLQGEDTDPVAVAAIARALAAARPCRVVLRNYRKDGTPFWNELVLSPVRDAEGRTTHVIGLQNDVTAREENAHALELAARHDLLTGLPNRALLVERALQALRRLHRHAGFVALLFVDVDGFKAVNDAHGHECGDRLLRELAARMEAVLRPADTLARIGGDEFVVLCEDVGAPAYAARIAQRVADAVREPVTLGAGTVGVDASVGIAVSDDPGAEVGALLRMADVAMYRAKRGGEPWAMADEDAASAASARLDLEEDLQHALEREELRLHYQPIVALEGFVLGVEALVRWAHPHQGLLLPTSFLAVAESIGLAGALSAWVLDRACADAAAWASALGERPLEVGVNLSIAELADPSFPARVRTTLDAHELDPARLVLEIKEHALGRAPAGLGERLDELRALGVRLALDGFGDGGGSVHALRRLGFDRVKIHRSFIAEAGDGDGDAATLLAALLAFGRSLKLATVVEGVETREQAELLGQLGARLAQGFFYSRPVEAAAVPGLVRR